MLTHQEAETLISARQDAPLSFMLERELQDHLQSCEACRSFAVATERLTAGLKAMPVGPASPSVRREVLARTRGGRNPLAGVFGGLNLQPGPAFASLAAVLLIAALGWFALDQFVFTDQQSREGEQLSPAPTVPSDVALFATDEPTDVPPTEIPATEVPATEVPATEVPATEVPPTEVPATEVPPTEVPPTEVPPTEVPATEVPPTAVPPTEVPPTEVPPTVVAPTATTEEEAPIDLTGRSGAESSATEAPEPTATDAPAEPTATEAPVEPTATTAPEPTAEPEPTATATEVPGRIEPMDGVVSTVESDDATEEPGVDETTTTTAPTPPIESVDDEGPVDLTTDETGEIEGTGSGEEATVAATDDAVTTVEADENTATSSLREASIAYQGINGNPAGMLALTSEGRLEFVTTPDGASFTTWEGYVLQESQSSPGPINLCGSDVCEEAVPAPESGEWTGDSPLGVMDGNAYYMRHFADRTEVYVAGVSGATLTEPRMLLSLEPVSPAMTVWESDGSLYTWLDSGTWIRVDSDGVEQLSGTFSNPSGTRFAPRSTPPLMGYYANGQLVIAPVAAPDQPVLAVSAELRDFDISPAGDRVAVIESNGIVILDMQGNVIHMYETDDMMPGSLIWLNGGIVFVDRGTGTLFQIPETGQ